MINKTQEEIIERWDNIAVPLVSVRCTAYNQEKYISECLDGILSQITTFPYEVIVHDDASTDNTATIIRDYELRYPLIIKAIYETENQYSKRDGSIGRILDKNSSGKYFATCEGDDYWIDENKLQEQVSFLESNPDYGLVYTASKQYIQEKNIFLSAGVETSFFQLITDTNYISNLTTCYRSDLYRRYIEDVNPGTKGWLMGDYPIWIYMSYYSKIHFIDKEMCVYRILSSSASHFTDIDKFVQFRKSVYDIKKFYQDKFGVKTDLKWDESVFYIPMYFEKAQRKKILDYKRPVSRKRDRIKVLLAKFPLIFYVTWVLCRIKNKLFK